MQAKARKGRGKIITEKEFNQIRVVLEQGYSTGDVANFVKRGISTIGRVKACKSYDEYQAYIRAEHDKQLKRIAYARQVRLQNLKQEKVEPVSQTPASTMSIEVSLLQNILSELKGIRFEMNRAWNAEKEEVLVEE